MNKYLLPIIILIASIGTSIYSSAQNYPAKSVKVIVPYPPGGGTDVIARVLTTQLSVTSGQTFFIDNRAGGDATIGAAIAAKSQNDGYTLLAVSGVPYVLNQIIYSKLPYNIIEDFEPVSLFASGPLILVVNPNVPVNTASEFIEYARLNQGKLNYAGSDQFTYLTMEMILLATNTKITHVPYKGVGPSLNDVVGGHIPVMLSSLAPAIPFINGKRLKALAVTSKQRSQSLPDVPTINESIIPDYEVTAWYGLFAPKGTSKKIINTLSDSINKTNETAEVKKNLTILGTDIVKSTPDEFKHFLKVELDKWGKVAKDTNIVIQ
ncbi:MAG: Bug family tripartite tricarboxylate transporter substrate binding protein [Burkholderiaceae bacterium]